MKKILFIILSLLPAVCLHAQHKGYDETRWQNIILEPVPVELKMSAQLYQLAKLAEADLAEANARLLNSTLRHRAADQTVNIEIVYRSDENLKDIKDKINTSYLKTAGFNIDLTWKNRASIWVKLDKLLSLATSLQKDYFIFQVVMPPADDQGPAAVNSTGYKTGGGPGGTGRRVAVFDYGFAGLQASINSGNAKAPAYVSLNGTPSTVAGVNIGGQEHGTACVETIYDHAPNANYELYVTDNATERGNAVNLCISHGVNVISMAISEYNTGWADDSGPACAYANAAANAGIIFCTSAGNRVFNHYEGLFKDANANNRHEFSGTEERNRLMTAISAGSNTHCYLSWNTASGADYDIAICRFDNNVVLANAATVGTTAAAFEYVSWTNNTGAAVNVYFRVTKRSGVATNIEMFTAGGIDYQFYQAAGSTTSPSNCTSPNVVSVGGADLAYFEEPSGTTDIILGYSGQGPTNSGNLAPKLTGPSLNTVFVYGGGVFSGTSSATANVAGAFTSFWSANPYLDATGVTQICYRTSTLYRDWGTAGADNIYGNGGMQLYSWEPNLRYMYRLPANVAVTNATRPFYNLSVAEANAPTDSKVILLNSGSFIENGVYGGPPGNGSGKKILYISPFPFDGKFGY